MKKVVLIFLCLFVTIAYSANLTNELKLEKNTNLKYYVVNDSKHLLKTSNGKMDKYDTIASSESFYADLLFYMTDGERKKALISLSNVSTYEKDPGKGMEIKSKNDITDLDEVGGEISFHKNGNDAKIESMDNVNSLSYLLVPDILDYLTKLAVPLPQGNAKVGSEWESEITNIQKYEFATLTSKHIMKYKLKAIKEFKGFECAEVDFETISNTYDSEANVSAFKSSISGKAMIQVATGIVVSLHLSNDFTLISEDAGLSYFTETSSFTEYMLR